MRFALVACLTLSACGSSNDSPTPTDAGADLGEPDTAVVVTAAQACDQYSQTLCEKIQSCLGIFIGVAYGDVARCKARIIPKCLDALGAPSSGAKPADLASCATAAKAASCEALLDNNPPKECSAKLGGLKNAAPCGDDSQCSTGFCGFDDAKRSCGVCGGKPLAGASCADGKKCGPGLLCAKNGKCAAPASEGATCDDTLPCHSALSCSAGKCQQKLVSPGAACGGANPDCDNTQSFFCINSHCEKVTFTEVGKDCGIEVDSTAMPAKVKSVTLCNLGWCKGVDPAKGVLKGTCAKAAADGEACMNDAIDKTAPPCLPPAICVSNKCVYPSPSTCK